MPVAGDRTAQQMKLKRDRQPEIKTSDRVSQAKPTHKPVPRDNLLANNKVSSWPKTILKIPTSKTPHPLTNNRVAKASKADSSPVKGNGQIRANRRATNPAKVRRAKRPIPPRTAATLSWPKAIGVAYVAMLELIAAAIPLVALKVAISAEAST